MALEREIMYNIDREWKTFDEAYQCLTVKYKDNFTAESAIAVLNALISTKAYIKK